MAKKYGCDSCTAEFDETELSVLRIAKYASRASCKFDLCPSCVQKILTKPPEGVTLKPTWDKWAERKQ